MVVVVGSSVQDFLHNFPEYESNLHQQVQRFYAFMASKGVHLDGHALRGIFNPEAVMKYAGQMFSELSTLLANGFVVLLMVTFILLGAGSLPAKIRVIDGTDDRKIRQLQKFNTSVKHYLLIKTVVSLVTGVLVSICVLVIGLDYPLMWGMLAFAFNYIPNIGSIIAAVPAVLFAVVQLGPGSSLAVAACYLVINIVMGNVFEPRFMGKRPKASAAERCRPTPPRPRPRS